MDTKLFIRGALPVATLLAAVATAPVQAALLSFDCITNNNTEDCTTGEAQLSVDVTDAGSNLAGSNLVLFTFQNSGPDASSIADVYFDDGTLLNIAAIDN